MVLLATGNCNTRSPRKWKSPGLHPLGPISTHCRHLDRRQHGYSRLLESAAQAAEPLGSSLQRRQTEPNHGRSRAEHSHMPAVATVHPKPTTEPQKITGCADVFCGHLARIG